MNKKLLSSILFMIFFVFGHNFIIAQDQEKPTLVFGKTYTKEELRKSNGLIRCASSEYEAYLQQKNPNRMTDAEFEAWISPLIENAKNNRSQSGGVITIPVVVHVIHSGQPLGTAPNITDNQVISQITVMNQDFRKMVGTPGYNTNPVGADVMIQFALAKVDPNGNPTNGIHRVNLCQSAWSTTEIDSYVKPQTIWDPTQYMNMWSVQFSNSSLLGYAQFPIGSGLQGLPTTGDANTDGVVANYSYFGSSDFDDGSFILGANYDKGRTMTHEVGHFLGLRHIWGDGSTTTACETDYCEDTPPAHQANYTCNTNIASCTTGLFEMVENYMDYTNDTCMNIFTNDQKTRMTTVMNNSPRRLELKTSVKDIAIPLFANDAELFIERSCTSASSSSCAVATATPLKMTIYNRGTSNLTAATINYSINGGATQTYNWTGSLATNAFSTFNVTVPTNATSGTVNANIVTANGGSDQRSTNNTATGTYTVATGPTNYQFNTVVFRLQRDYYGAETTWTLKNSGGTTLFSGGPYTNTTSTSPLPAIITQTWNLPSNDCYTFTINDTGPDGICCAYGAGYYDLKSQDGSTIIASGGQFGATESKSFKIMTLATNEVDNNEFEIYPNPVSDVLQITKVSDRTTYKIFNTASQLVQFGTIKDGKIAVDNLVKGNYIITINDNNINANLKFIKK